MDNQITTNYTEFQSRAYVEEQWGINDRENQLALRHLYSAYQRILPHLPPAPRLLELAGGPVPVNVISASNIFEEIIFAEYLQENCIELLSWLNEEPDAFNYDCFFRYALQLEGIAKPTSYDVERRKAQVRNKVHLLGTDLFRPHPLGSLIRPSVDVIAVNYGPESIASNKQEFELLMRNIANLFNPDTYLVMSALENANSYRAGAAQFASYPVNAEYLTEVLLNLNFDDITVDSQPITQGEDNVLEVQDYTGLLFATSRKL
jgi:hypothetical protein